MTTIRLTSTQKKKLREAQGILEKVSRRRVSQGAAVAALADFALRNRVLLSRAAEQMPPDREGDPFYDLSIVFDLGPTDAGTHDRVLYGRR
jgi:hypothetical protein